MLTHEEEKELARHYAEDIIEDEIIFDYDEIVKAEPKIFSMIEDQDLFGLQQYLLKVGGF